MRALATHSPSLRPSPQSGAQSGGAGFALLAGAAHPFPADLEALAQHHASSIRLMSCFDGLRDLIEQCRNDLKSQDGSPEGQVAEAALDGLLDLKEALASRIVRLGQEAAVAEARQLDEDFADLTLDELQIEIGHLRPEQRAALLWAQADAARAGLMPQPTLLTRILNGAA